MAKNDTYKEPIIIEKEGFRARVFVPILTEEERKRRLKLIEKAAADLLRENNEKAV